MSQEQKAKFEVETFFDQGTYTLTYIVYDPETRDAIIIDPVWDYEPGASKTYTQSLDLLNAFLQEKDLKVHYIMETHAHADHLSGSQILAKKYGGEVVIGKNIQQVQKVFKQIFGLPTDFRTDGSQFDRLVDDGETLKAGSLDVKVINTPGHTPACVTYKVGDAIFTGDALFMHDYGTGRCDFPGGDAESMYDSIHGKLYQMPDETRVFVGHDYQPGGRELAYETTIGQSKAENPQLRADTTKEEYVKFRNDRDATLSAPKLLFQSVQVNIDAGHLPAPSENEVRYLKIPVNVFRGAEQSGITEPEDVSLEERAI